MSESKVDRTYNTFRHDVGACFTCPRCGFLEEYVNTKTLGSVTTDCKCGSKTHHFINDNGKPVFRLIPTARDLQYMERFPNKVSSQTYETAKYNRQYWQEVSGDVPADY